MTTGHAYNPDCAVHPGGAIAELLEEIGMRQAHLAGACRVSPKHLNQVVRGVKPLHATLAVAIEFSTGRRVADVLMTMQARYDVHRERQRRATEAQAMADYFGAYVTTDEEDPT